MPLMPTLIFHTGFSFTKKRKLKPMLIVTLITDSKHAHGKRTCPIPASPSRCGHERIKTKIAKTQKSLFIILSDFCTFVVQSSQGGLMHSRGDRLVLINFYRIVFSV